MVVCNTSLMQLPTACSITPVSPYLCTLPTITCRGVERYPILSTPLIAATAPIPCPPGLPPQSALPLTPPTSPHSTPPNSPARGTPPLNGLNIVPCTTNLVSLTSLTNGITSILPFTQVPFTPKLETSPIATTNSVSTPQCNPQVYTCTPLTSTVVCTPRVINGHNVLQCTPCPITPVRLSLPTSPEVIPSGPVIPTTPPPPLYPSSLSSNLHASPWKQSYGMEQVWQSQFKQLFLQYAPHNWILFNVNVKPEGLWNANVDSAKVRFCCEDCGHGWTSMKGRVAFWFLLNPINGEGAVCLKLYGQQCDRCKSGNYESAMWYPEEVLKVLVNIYNRVGQVYYGFQQAPYHRARRAGKPRTPHNSDLCQACKDGVCSERR